MSTQDTDRAAALVREWVQSPCFIALSGSTDIVHRIAALCAAVRAETLEQAAGVAEGWELALRPMPDDPPMAAEAAWDWVNVWVRYIAKDIRESVPPDCPTAHTAEAQGTRDALDGPGAGV